MISGTLPSRQLHCRESVLIPDLFVSGRLWFCRLTLLYICHIGIIGPCTSNFLNIHFTKVQSKFQTAMRRSRIWHLSELREDVLQCCRGLGVSGPQLVPLFLRYRTNTTAARQFAVPHANCLRPSHFLSLGSGNIAKAWYLPKSCAAYPPRVLPAPDSPAQDVQGQCQMTSSVRQLSREKIHPFQEFEHLPPVNLNPCSQSSSSKNEIHSARHSQYMDQTPKSCRWYLKHFLLQQPWSESQAAFLPYKQFLDASGQSNRQCVPWNVRCRSWTFQLDAERLSLVWYPCWRRPLFGTMSVHSFCLFAPSGYLADLLCAGLGVAA